MSELFIHLFLHDYSQRGLIPKADLDRLIAASGIMTATALSRATGEADGNISPLFPEEAAGDDRGMGVERLEAWDMGGIIHQDKARAGDQVEGDLHDLGRRDRG